LLREEPRSGGEKSCCKRPGRAQGSPLIEATAMVRRPRRRRHGSATSPGRNTARTAGGCRRRCSWAIVKGIEQVELTGGPARLLVADGQHGRRALPSALTDVIVQIALWPPQFRSEQAILTTRILIASTARPEQPHTALRLTVPPGDGVPRGHRL
jgi:hypothetical protein